MVDAVVTFPCFIMVEKTELKKQSPAAFFFFFFFFNLELYESLFLPHKILGQSAVK